jgi:hypothetical protein
LRDELGAAFENDHIFTVLNLFGVACVTLSSVDPPSAYVLARFLERSARLWRGTDTITDWATNQRPATMTALDAQSDTLDLSSAFELTVQSLERAAGAT